MKGEANASDNKIKRNAIKFQDEFNLPKHQFGGKKCRLTIVCLVIFDFSYRICQGIAEKRLARASGATIERFELGAGQHDAAHHAAGRKDFDSGKQR